MKKRLGELQPGQSLVIPGGWSDETGGHAVTYIVECEREDSYAFVICNTGEGLKYHPASGNFFEVWALTIQQMISPRRNSRQHFVFLVLKRIRLYRLLRGCCFSR